MKAVNHALTVHGQNVLNMDTETEIEITSIEELNPNKLYLIKVEDFNVCEVTKLQEAMRTLGIKGLVVSKDINFLEIASLFEGQSAGVKEKILNALK